MTDEKRRLDALERQVGDVSERLDQVLELLRAKFGAPEPELARGTTEQSAASIAAAAVRAADSASLKRAADHKRVLDCVREVACTSREIAKRLRMDVERVDEILTELREADAIVNINTDVRPRWFFKVGDAADPVTLAGAVRYLLREAPRTLQDLVDLTGARESRVNGVRITMVRHKERLINVGTGRIAKWFLVPKKVPLETE